MEEDGDFTNDLMVQAHFYLIAITQKVHKKTNVESEQHAFMVMILCSLVANYLKCLPTTELKLSIWSAFIEGLKYCIHEDEGEEKKND